MAGEEVSAPGRWAGVPLTDRPAERRALLVDAAYELFGTGGEAAVTVRAVCRHTGLHSRYFYESFADTDELLGAVYDRVAEAAGVEVTAALAEAGTDPVARLRAGMHGVLGFSSADPRRGKVLFTEARTNPVLTDRRYAAQLALMEGVLQEGGRTRPTIDPRLAKVGAAMFTGAMVELVGQWLAGNLGDDLDAVVDHALELLLAGLLAPAQGG